MFDSRRLEEKITLEPYKDHWKEWYIDEIKQLKNIFMSNLIGIEHFGSSSVPGLYSKPIVDIMVGLKDFEVDEELIHKLENIGYEYFGQLHSNQERFFARKRKERNFNLAIVPYGKEEWMEKITFRDYLRVHPEKVKQYSEIKIDALLQGKETLLAYHEHKEIVVKKLLKEALKWKQRNI